MISCYEINSQFMKSYIKTAFFARAGPVRLRFSGGGSSLKLRGFTPNTPLLPFILSLIPILVALRVFCSIRHAACFGSAHCRAQGEPGNQLVLEEHIFGESGGDGKGQGRQRGLGVVTGRQWRQILAVALRRRIRLVREVGRREPQGAIDGRCNVTTYSCKSQSRLKIGSWPNSMRRRKSDTFS